MIASDFHGNLNDDNKALLSYNYATSCYSGSIVNRAMNDWNEANCT
jgi:hypothetical protein